jgi:hypothetical protein
VIRDQLHAVVAGHADQEVEVADAHRGVARAQHGVEACIALAGVATADVEGPVQRETTAVDQDSADPFEHGLDLRLGHDVGGVGAEHGIEAFVGPGARDVEHAHGRQIGQGGIVQPGPDSGEIVRAVAGLPDQMGQGGGEEDRVLTGAASDLEEIDGNLERSGRSRRESGACFLRRLPSRVCRSDTWSSPFGVNRGCYARGFRPCATRWRPVRMIWRSGRTGRSTTGFSAQPTEMASDRSARSVMLHIARDPLLEDAVGARVRRRVDFY